MMPYIITLNVGKVHFSTTNRFSTARKNGGGGRGEEGGGGWVGGWGVGVIYVVSK